MDVKKAAETLSNKFIDRKPLLYQEHKGDGPLEHTFLSVLFPWEHAGKTNWVTATFTIARMGIISSISIDNKKEEQEVYAGMSVDRAYMAIVQWLWRYANFGQTIEKLLKNHGGSDEEDCEV